MTTMKIMTEEGVVTLADFTLTEENGKRYDLLYKEQVAGRIMVIQMITNHKLGIMDINEALEKLFN